MFTLTIPTLLTAYLLPSPPSLFTMIDEALNEVLEGGEGRGGGERAQHFNQSQSFVYSPS